MAYATGKLKVLPAVNMTPVMAVRMRQVQISAIMRVSLSPVLDDLPFIGGISLSLMSQPYIDFDLRYALSDCSYQEGSSIPIQELHTSSPSLHADADLCMWCNAGWWQALISCLCRRCHLSYRPALWKCSQTTCSGEPSPLGASC